jgi:light-regulated signal transduction histidine kinase (bacteriophytochrome)
MRLQTQQMLVLSKDISRLRKTAKLDTFYQKCVRELQAISCYNHVMLYRFLPDESGEVIADVEALVGTLVPLLLLSGQALDAGQSLLHGMSPSHIVYLRNMG